VETYTRAVNVPRSLECMSVLCVVLCVVLEDYCYCDVVVMKENECDTHMCKEVDVPSIERACYGFTRTSILTIINNKPT